MPREIHHAAGRQKFLGPKVRRKALDAKVDAIGNLPETMVHLPLIFEREINIRIYKRTIFHGQGSISRK